MKAGSLGDGALDVEGAMAAEIEREMVALWSALRGQALPANEDRLILFTAIARGVLGYLKSHPTSLVASGTVASGTISNGRVDVTVEDVP